MRILGICCSPRKGGNTEILLREALEGAREAGCETELILVAGKKIAACDGCNSCSSCDRHQVDANSLQDRLLIRAAVVGFVAQHTCL